MRLLQHYRPYICPFCKLVQSIPKNAEVLDVGCGGGLLLALLARTGRLRRGVGFDTSAIAIETAQKVAARIKTLNPEIELHFEVRSVSDGWPEGPFQVVSIIDVMHHVPPVAMRSVVDLAVERLAPGGLLLYKDMVSHPVVRAWANRFHDLLLARQWIHYLPIKHLETWASESGLELIESQTINCFWYGHDFRLFRKL